MKRIELNRYLAVASLTLALLPASAAPASAQSRFIALRAFVGLHGTGAELEAGKSRAAVFVRGDSWIFGNFTTLTAGARVWPLGSEGQGVYLYSGLARIRCGQVSFNEQGTGCDGGWHSSIPVGAGLDVGSPGEDMSVFMEGGSYLKDRGHAAVPDWTFSAGFRVRLK
jgi:hypothetical protein